MSNYDELISRVKELSVIESIGGLLAWDQETYMPPQGTQLRSESLAYLSKTAHSVLIAPEMGVLLNSLENDNLTDAESANVREIRRSYNKATKLPTSLVEEMARHNSTSLQIWQEARAKSDFAHFAPALEKTLDLACQAAEHYGYKENIYDAMLDIYEQGMSVSQLDLLFASLRKEIVPLVKAIGECDNHPDLSFMKTTSFSKEGQRDFSLRVSKAIGFDFEGGRMDTSTHPFCSGAGPGDVRFTTRYDESFPFGCLYGVMHETGHGLYEQGLSKEHEGTPLSKAVSLGVHESQSRLWENVVGRSREFWNHWLSDFCEVFPDVGDLDLDTIHHAVNNVEPSLIRVEADEVTYNLHIMIRYEVEKALVNGEVKVNDLPQFWNSQMENYLGIIPPNDAQGVLQDVHWSMGAFGYFPTYTLGNLYAAQLWEATLRDIPDMLSLISQGETKPLLDWMRNKIHVHGSLWEPEDLIFQATGEKPSSDAFVRYLKQKFNSLYHLS